MKFKFSPFLFTLFFLFFATFFRQQFFHVFAQSMSSGIAFYVDISDKNVKPGNIISFTNKNYHLSRMEYDPSAYGVVTDNPAVAVSEQPSSPTSYAIVSNGKTYVLVTSKSGEI